MARRNQPPAPIRPALSRYEAFKQSVTTFAAEHPVFIACIQFAFVLMIAVFVAWLLLPVAPLVRQKERASSPILPSPNADISPPPPSDVSTRVQLRQALCEEGATLFALSRLQLTDAPEVSEDTLCEVGDHALYGNDNNDCEVYIERIGDPSKIENIAQLLEFHVAKAMQYLAACKAEQAAAQAFVQAGQVVLYRKGEGQISWEHSGISISNQAKIIEAVKEQKAPVLIVPPGGVTGHATTLVEAFENNYIVALSFEHTKAYLEFDTSRCGVVLIFSNSVEQDFTIKMTSGNNPIDKVICDATGQGKVVGVVNRIGPDAKKAVLIPKSLQPASAASSSESLSSQAPINEHIQSWSIEAKSCGEKVNTPFIFSAPPPPLKSPKVPDETFCKVDSQAIVGNCEMYISRIADVNEVVNDLEGLLRLHTVMATKYLSECKAEQAAAQTALQPKLAQIGLYRKGEGRIDWASAGLSASTQATIIEQMKKQKTPMLVQAPAGVTTHAKEFVEAFDMGYLIAISYVHTSASIKMDTGLCGKILILNDGYRHESVFEFQSGGNPIDIKVCEATNQGTTVAVEKVFGDDHPKSVLIPQTLFGPGAATSPKASKEKVTGASLSEKAAAKNTETPSLFQQPKKSPELIELSLETEQSSKQILRIPMPRRVAVM